MKKRRKQIGFSLIEINMAVFVMAVGILGMIALYPLGLRESTQGQADLKQSMFADYVLNQLVAAASQTNITWSEWTDIRNIDNFPEVSDGSDYYLPSFLKNLISGKLKIPGNDWEDMSKHYKIACCLVPGASDRIMGIMVQSTEMTEVITKYSQMSNNPTYYAEVMFQGKSAQ